jgi:hypothetical protein
VGEDLGHWEWPDAKEPLSSSVRLRIRVPWPTCQCPNHNFLDLPTMLPAPCQTRWNLDGVSSNNVSHPLSHGPSSEHWNIPYFLPIGFQPHLLMSYANDICECVMHQNLWNVLYAGPKSTNVLCIKSKFTNVSSVIFIYTNVSYTRSKFTNVLCTRFKFINMSCVRRHIYIYKCVMHKIQNYTYVMRHIHIYKCGMRHIHMCHCNVLVV